MVDRISISGESHGGRGGERSPQLILQKEEYIERIEIRSGSQIDFVKFTTNLGQSIGGGGDGGDLCLLENIRLLGIAGRSGSTLDGLTFFFEEL